MQLQQIFGFVTVVDCGSIRAAARRLGVSQPGLTKSLRQLEASLDTQLLQRGASGVTLTDAGKLFLVRARAVHAELKRAQDELLDLAGRRSGIVSIGVASMIGALLMPATLQRFRMLRPDAEVRVVEGTQDSLLPLLREGGIDMAACLRMEADQTTGFSVRSLARVRPVVVGRKGHPLCGAKNLTQLQDAQWAMIRPRGAMGLLEQVFRNEGLQIPTSSVHCGTHGIQLAIVSGSDALAVMARQMLDQPPAKGLLEALPLRRPLPLLTLGLYKPADMPMTAVAADLATAFAAAARQVLRVA